ncbi:methyltransferase domain-containing protein [Candidatus Woesearchaeota archaeon]|nr:MAG: methyltransferase domain-containing protein [Candidatus Woesearchaeota archaeon]
MRRIERIAVTRDGHRYFIKDKKSDYHTQYGIIKAEDMNRNSCKTNTGKDVFLFAPAFKDFYDRIKRGPQMVPLKDVGLVIAETGMGRDSIVVDSGSGSGGTALMFGRVAKKVYSFEMREDFLKIAEENRRFAGLSNVKFALHDITEGIPVKSVDIVFLDMPSPWLVVKHAEKALKRGGFLVSYSPTVPQVMDFVEEVKSSEKFIILKTVEVAERDWEIEGRKVRPRSQRIGHSGFMTFCRRVC